MGRNYSASPPQTKLGVGLDAWLRRLIADHDGTALIVAKVVGSLIIEVIRFRLNRVCDLTGHVLAGFLDRLRRRAARMSSHTTIAAVILNMVGMMVNVTIVTTDSITMLAKTASISKCRLIPSSTGPLPPYGGSPAALVPRRAAPNSS
jgi:hypothetical protein